MTERKSRAAPRAEGPWGDLALHSIGWKAFQDLCSQVVEEVLRRPVQIHREAQDGGQDAVFVTKGTEGEVEATIQCKHSSDATRRLTVGDLRREMSSVVDLVAAGQADTYVLMTSMRVDAPVALAIKARLRAVGVRKPYVLGREYLIRAIRGSARLRALVPQVYGLGDLATIVDQRLVQQTQALLDRWIPKLRLYVPTRAHRRAVDALQKHRVVLLLGNPSTGKSTIGAILSTIAAEETDATVLQVTSPREFEASWSPHDRRRFFWIDDAFGSNVVRDDYVQDWTSAFTKVQAATDRGSRFLLTSRRHIYEAARRTLGSRNHPLFADGKAVVDVGELTSDERAQILYNHIHFGQQTQSWKRSAKRHLDAVARVPDFLPGIAERLGDPAFTRSVATSETELVRFMREPREHLVDTINALDDPLRAALMLIYVHRGRLVGDATSDEASVAVARSMDVPLPRIQERMHQLAGSFAHRSRIEGRDVWTFAHPTIADALTDILRERPHMIAALVLGATSEAILGGFACEGAPTHEDAPVIPTTLDDLLVRRLVACEDAADVNWALLSFLANRASDAVTAKVLAADPTILDRRTYTFFKAAGDPKLLVHRRAMRLGLLDAARREWAVDRLERAAFDDFDLSFVDDPDMLSLIPPRRLVALGLKLRVSLLPAAVDMIETTSSRADADDDPESHFGRFAEGLDLIEAMAGDEDTEALVAEAREAVKAAISDMSARKGEPEADEGWEHLSARPLEEDADEYLDADAARRSVFEDVDR